MLELPVPVIRSVYAPAAAVPAFTVSVADPPELMDEGLMLAVAPKGSPETERLTVCEVPEVVAVEIVAVPEVFCSRVNVSGLIEMEKSLTTSAVTVRTMFVERVVVPVAVTTIV